MSRVLLRALSISDFDTIYKWHTSKELYTALMGPFRYVSEDAEREWLQNKAKFSNQEINLLICLIENSQPIGMISVRDIDWISRQGQLTGILIGELEYRNESYGSEAIRILLKHFFLDLGLHRLWAYVLSENEPSLKLFVKAGFLPEGKLKDHAFKDGQFKDVEVVGLCADRYFQLLKEKQED